MPPVATNDNSQPVNPFYSPSTEGDKDEGYRYPQYKVSVCPNDRVFLTERSKKPHFPDVSWKPLTEIQVEDRGLHADPSKANLLAAASKVTHLTPAIGTELRGIDLRQLTPQQKDELYVGL